MLILLEHELRMIVSSSMRDMIPDRVYRVSIDNNTKLVHTISFGMETIDVSQEKVYSSINKLPMWAQERIALLMMTDAKAPTTEVDGVGRRIDEDTFWLYD
jgi:hypothetical protein